MKTFSNLRALGLLLLAAPLAVIADSIAFGTVQNYGTTPLRYMWIDGQDPCNRGNMPGIPSDCYNEGGVNACTTNDNPCGHKFTLTNGKSYKLENCGSSSFSLNYYSSGSYISTASYKPWSTNCGDSSGNLQVTKTWQFTCNKPGC